MGKPPTLLEANRVFKYFGGLKAVSNVSFALNQGEILGLIGPNGAGKTTLFNILSGFLPPDKGEIRFKGERISRLKPHEICKKGITRTFQIVKPFLHLTVLNNVAIGALNRTYSVREAEEKALTILQQVGLEAKKDLPVEALTLADRKRLELARAMATEPQLLLLDEVMAGLNPAEIQRFIELLERINAGGMTILLIEHVMKAVMNLSQRVIVLNAGEVIAEGLPQEVTRNRQVIEAYLGEEFFVAQS
ncbi:MAG: ABC transporter ATP-binding protein [Candidatus Tectomicrobia bacterium]|nr:ABC transporter ATP-binding protein [Candidatus Tectomicrobia bacterium]